MNIEVQWIQEENILLVDLFKFACFPENIDKIKLQNV